MSSAIVNGVTQSAANGIHYTIQNRQRSSRLENENALMSQPRTTVTRFTDFDQLAAFFSGWNGRIEQLSLGRFEGALHVAPGELVRAVCVEFNQVILLRGQGAAGQVSVYPVAPRNSTALWQGRRLRPGVLVAHGPAAEADHVSARHGSNLGASVAPADLEHATRLLLNDHAAIPRTWAALATPPDANAALDRHLRHFLALAAGDPTLIGTAEGRRLEQNCVRALALAIAPPAGRRLPDPPLASRAALVRRAEGLMRANLRGRLGAIDLCAELGASDRTLRLAFRERYGLGPMAYFKTVRLNAVRAALKSDPALLVSAVAREHGFHHLGNFAADYRRAFGVNPSGDEGRSAKA